MKDVKILLIAILIVALCATLFYACNQRKQNARAIATAKEKDSVLSAIVHPERIYKDSTGAMHIVIANRKAEQRDLSAMQRLTPFIDSVAKALDIKPKQVESVMVIPTETQAKEVAFLQKKIDSLQRVTYYYKDKYLQLSIKSGNPTDTTDKGSFDFKYDADLTISQYWKRKKFLGIRLGSKQSYTDISSNDPRTTIRGLKKYTVLQKQPSFGLRIQAIQNYSFISNSANTGIRATFDLKHLSFTGGYYYNWDLRQWRPSISLGYDLIRF